MNSAAETPIQDIPDISSAIGKIMEHPELISMVASVLGKDSTEKSNSDNNGDTAVAEDTQASVSPSPPPEVISTLMPMLSKISALGGGDVIGKKSFKHEALLCALKPYLSSSRVEAIDYIIKISKMSSLIQGLK